jgi:putative oxidoreductase
MTSIVSAAAQALGRVLLALIFIVSGWAKLNAMAGTVAYMTSGGLPSPDLLYYLVVAVELGGGILMLLGFQTRLVALGLAIYCVVSGVMFHYQPSNAGQMTQYFKNIAMAGGFLQLFAVGGGAWSLDRLLKR